MDDKTKITPKDRNLFSLHGNTVSQARGSLRAECLLAFSCCNHGFLFILHPPIGRRNIIFPNHPNLHDLGESTPNPQPIPARNNQIQGLESELLEDGGDGVSKTGVAILGWQGVTGGFMAFVSRNGCNMFLYVFGVGKSIYLPFHLIMGQLPCYSWKGKHPRLVGTHFFHSRLCVSNRS